MNEGQRQGADLGHDEGEGQGMLKAKSLFVETSVAKPPRRKTMRKGGYPLKKRAI